MALGLTSYRPPIMGITHMVSAGQYLAAAAGYRILEQAAMRSTPGWPPASSST